MRPAGHLALSLLRLALAAASARAVSAEIYLGPYAGLAFQGSADIPASASGVTVAARDVALRHNRGRWPACRILS